MVLPLTSREPFTNSHSRTSAPMESCQSAPALDWATMSWASLLSETISPVISRALFLTLAEIIPTRLSVLFSWFVSKGTVSGISIPARSTTTGNFHPGKFIFPPP